MNKNTLYRYTFNFDTDLTKVTVKSVFKNISKFDGTSYTVKATPNEIIVACGDCSIPAVYFFSSDLEQFEGGEFTIDNSNKGPLTIATDFQNLVRQTQVFVGANAKAMMIKRQSDVNGIEHWETNTNIYQGTISNNTDSSVSIGRGP